MTDWGTDGRVDFKGRKERDEMKSESRSTLGRYGTLILRLT